MCAVLAGWRHLQYHLLVTLPCVTVCGVLRGCRLPLEADSAALGGALQAAACHGGEGVGAYVAANQPPLSEEVRPARGVREGGRETERGGATGVL